LISRASSASLNTIHGASSDSSLARHALNRLAIHILDLSFAAILPNVARLGEVRVMFTPLFGLVVMIGAQFVRRSLLHKSGFIGGGSEPSRPSPPPQVVFN
jgi:hypothetical protein